MSIADLTGSLNSFMWGPWTFLILMGSGILFTIWTKFIQFRALTHGVQVTRGVYDDPNDPGAISHFQALSAALSATVGLGNIGGVALAIALGGPGALFWIWVVGFLGMALKTIEVTLALLHRKIDPDGEPHGGAMWVIENTLGKKGGGYRTLAKVLAGLFCVTLVISTFTGGNMFQSWNVASLFEQYFRVPQLVSGAVLAVLVGLVIIGGIKRIGNVAGRIVPLMCGLYVLAGFAVLGVNIEQLPSLLVLVVKSAFSPVEATGGFVGAGAYYAFSAGLRRALFSNEAGQGSAPIAHSAARTEYAGREGVVAGLEPFIDTICICTLSALVILSTGTWNRDAEGPINAPITLEASAERTWTVSTAAGVADLPALPGGDQWADGNTFYLLARVQGSKHADLATDVVRVEGTVRRKSPETKADGVEDGALFIDWAPIVLDAASWPEAPSGLVLQSPGVWRTYAGASLTAVAFDRAFPGLGKWLVSLAALLFAFSTMISWSYYGEQGVLYLFGRRALLPYKLVFVLAIIGAPFAAGTGRDLEALIDFGTGAMLWANMPIVLLMGHMAVKHLRDYFRRLDAGEFKRQDAPSLVDVEKT